MRLKNWKEGLEMKGLQVKIGKTRVMCSKQDAPNTKITSVRFPCGVCQKGVETNSIFCLSCYKWVHKQCSGRRKCFRNCKDFICKTCSTVKEVDDPMCKTVDGDGFETVSEFCYLGEIMGQAGGCIQAVTAHIQSVWKAFHELLPILRNRPISLLNRGKVFMACVRGLLLYGSETWPMSTGDIKTSDIPMIQWICGVKIKQ